MATLHLGKGKSQRSEMVRQNAQGMSPNMNVNHANVLSVQPMVNAQTMLNAQQYCHKLFRLKVN